MQALTTTSDKPLKFLFLSSDKYPPFRVDVTILFGRELVSRGHHIDMILQSEGPCDRAMQTVWSGCRVWVGPTDLGTSRLARLRKHVFSVLHDFKLFRLLRRTRYDFVQVKDKFLSAVLALLAARLFRTRFVYWLSYPFPEASLHHVRQGTARYRTFYLVRGHTLDFLLYRVILPAADMIFVQSEQMKKDVVARGIDGAKLAPVPMGISLADFPPSRSDKRAEPGHRIVYIGTLAKIRRMDFLVRVLQLVRREIPDAQLWLVGDGDDTRDRAIIEQEAERLALRDAITITGFVPRAEAFRHVASADVCVSPFYPMPILNSTSPTKLIEYMALGKAVVANDHPEQRLVIEQSRGGLCVAYDEQAFADAIVYVLRHPQEAASMGERGRRYVEKYRTYTSIADALERRYFELIRPHADGATA